MKLFVRLLIGMIVLVIFPGFLIADSREVFVDINGNKYKTVKIGNQVWMAENLKVTKDREGNPIKTYCFDDDAKNCEKYGCLYTWEVALKVASKGWHLPSNEEWTKLLNYCGGGKKASEKLLIGGSSGFEAYLAGGADFRGNYLYMGEAALFWSSTEANQQRAYHQGIDKNGRNILFAAMKGARISIRLIKDKEK